MSRRPLKKSGKNKFAGYEYFELQDILPTAHDVFNKVGLCGVFSIFDNVASLQVYETDTGASISFQSPLVMAENAKGQAIQSMGSTHTYFRRYLWLMALELTEHDAVDSSDPGDKKPEPELKKEVIDQKTGEINPPAKIEGKGGEWNIKITAKDGASAEQWSETVFDSAMICLRAAKTVDDVMTIFRVNRAIFDRLRADDEPLYTSLMNEFKLAKESFNAIP